MTEFKVGDEVEITAKSPHAGSVGKITEHRGAEFMWPWKVEFAGKPYGIFHSGELQLVTPGHKFEVGDWVEVTGWGGSWNGRVLQIEAVPDSWDKFYRFKGQGGVGFSDKHLKAAENPTLAESKAAHPSNGKAEAVEHPAHYGGDNTYEVIKVAEAWGLDKDAYLFNVLKYIARAGKKGSKLEDLQKGGFYMNRRIKQEEAK